MHLICNDATMPDLNQLIMHNLTFAHKHPTNHLAEGAKPNWSYLQPTPILRSQSRQH